RAGLASVAHVHERERQADERQNGADDDEDDDPKGHGLTLSGGRMKFGIQVGHLGGPLDELRRLLRFADKRGFDWLSVPDHFQETPGQGGGLPCLESIAMLTAAAIETKRLRIGCLVVYISHR